MQPSAALFDEVAQACDRLEAMNDAHVDAGYKKRRCARHGAACAGKGPWKSREELVSTSTALRSSAM